jgi:ribosome maturation protein Sdo1
VKITTDDLKQIIKEELKEGYLSGTAEETVLEMQQLTRNLFNMIKEAEKRGAAKTYPLEFEKAKQAYRAFYMAYQDLEGKVTSYISG